MTTQAEPLNLSPNEIRKTLDIFLKAWSVSAVADYLECSTDEALDFLEREEIQALIEERSDRLHKLYSRMPKTVYLELIMNELHNVDGSTTATKIQSLLNCFLTWYKESPPPSNTEFAEALLAEFRKAS